jgi:branched-chain amino acid transport system ATP-binding protein
MSVMLTVTGLTRSFGGVRAVSDVSFTVEAGTIRGLIGPNGAGKTTLLDLITGFTRPDRGKVSLEGRTITGIPSHRLAALGLMRTFQAARLIPGLSVRDNVMLGAHHLTRAGFWADGLRLPSSRKEETALRQRAERVLGFLDLGRYASRDARELPTGLQRLVELGRALAAGPRLLLVDEPAAGLDEAETDSLTDALKAIRASGCTVLLIEHNVNLVLSITDSVLVLNAGSLIADDSPDRIRANEAVRAAYLGQAV